MAPTPFPLSLLRRDYDDNDTYSNYRTTIIIVIAVVIVLKVIVIVSICSYRRNKQAQRIAMMRTHAPPREIINPPTYENSRYGFAPTELKPTYAPPQQFSNTSDAAPPNARHDPSMVAPQYDGSRDPSRERLLERHEQYGNQNL